MRARGSSVSAGFAWNGPARVAPASGGMDSAGSSKRWRGWGGASGGGKWGETERRPNGEIGQGLGIAGRVRLWSLDVCGVDGSDGVLGSDQREPFPVFSLAGFHLHATHIAPSINY
jgi:hypothetical protein